jgi:uncharacterized protein
MSLPIFPLDVVAFPGMTVPLYVFEARYRRLVRYVLEHEPKRFVIALARPRGLDAEAASMAGVGTVMDVARVEERVDGTFELIAHAQERTRVAPSEREDVPEPDGVTRPLFFTPYDPWPLERDDPNEERIAAWDALDAFRRYAATVFAFDAQQQIDANLPDDPLFQASLVCANIRVPSASRQVLLEAPSLVVRFRLAQKLIEERLAAHAPVVDEAE